MEVESATIGNMDLLYRRGLPTVCLERNSGQLLPHSYQRGQQIGDRALRHIHQGSQLYDTTDLDMGVLHRSSLSNQRIEPKGKPLRLVFRHHCFNLVYPESWGLSGSLEKALGVLSLDFSPPGFPRSHQICVLRLPIIL